MSKVEYVNPAALCAPPGNFSWLTQSGNIIWLSGMVAVDRSGAFIGEGDVEAQTQQIYANVDAALRERGGSISNLVKTVTYVVGRENLGPMQRVRAAWKQSGKLTNLPASTLLLVAGLASPEYLVEMDAVAVVG